MDKMIRRAYLDILEEELIPAMGCTEPIAVAYAGALARQTLGALPEAVELTVSGNIIKNVKSVIVPHTGGRKGLRTAVAAGILFGDADRQLEVLSDAGEEELARLDGYLTDLRFTLERSDAPFPFDLQVRAAAGRDNAYVRIVGHHTNVVSVRRNDTILVDRAFSDERTQTPENRSLLTVEEIVRFADEADVNDLRPVLGRQIELNMEIARE